MNELYKVSPNQQLHVQFGNCTICFPVQMSHILWTAVFVVSMCSLVGDYHHYGRTYLSILK
jgi:hypothetical protein